MARGLLARLLSRRACRALAALGAYLFAFQAMGLTNLVSESAASCCCTRREQGAKCGCRACTHGRELEAGKPLLKTCGGGDDEAAPSPSMPVVVPAPAVREVARARMQAPRGVPLPQPLSPPLEVPTPPPLA